MSIVVGTNTSSLMVQRNLSTATQNISTSLERLSTGSRINQASDDAAGLTIATGLQTQDNGIQIAASNATSGVNLLQTAEADLGIIQTNLQRIRNLSVQAANGTYGTTERGAIKSEVKQRIMEISRLANSSAFNTIKLLNGSNTTLSLQIGQNHITGQASLNTLSIGVPLGNATATALGIASATNSSFIDKAFASASSSSSYINKIDSALTTVTDRRTIIGALQNRLQSAVQSLSVRQENLASALSNIQDTDIAQESSNLTKNQILQQASATLLAQANQTPNIALSLIKG